MHDTLTLPSLSTRRIPADLPATFARQAASLPQLCFKRILVPFDLSRASVCALRAVAGFAARTSATVHLLHVVRPDASGIEPKCNRADDHLADDSERLLKHWVKRLVQGRAQTFVSVRIGEPVDVILARAVATEADLIVMTSRSCSGLKNELQRSSAERVSRLAPCPVLTIPEKCTDAVAYSTDAFPPASWRTVFVPVDFSATAEMALRYASSIARANRGTIHLAHGAHHLDAEDGSVHTRLASWAELTLGDEPVCNTIAWPGGHSLYAILSEALRTEADLIVLPTRAQSWAERLRAGSITDGVLRQAPCPVLSINERNN